MITDNNYKVVYPGDAVTTEFAFNFAIIQETDLLVQIVNQGGTLHELDLNIDYTVAGTGNSEETTTDYTSGTVTIEPAPLSGETVIIKLNIPLTQLTDYEENSKFPAKSHEKALDKLTLIAKQQQEQLDRSFKVDYTSQNFTDYTLPVGQANYYIRFNGDGTGLEAVVGTPASSIEVELDPSPSLGGNLDTNGNEIISQPGSNVTITPGGTNALDINTDTIYVGQDIIHDGDTDTKLSFTTNTVTTTAGGVTGIDVNASGVRLGGANSRVTTILSEDDMASSSATALATQNSIKNYVTNYSVFKAAPVLGGNLDTAGYNIVTTIGNQSLTVDLNGSGSFTVVADTGGIIDLNSSTILVNTDLTHRGDTDTKIGFGTDTITLSTGGTSRLDVNNSGLQVGTGARITNISTDGTFASNSDTLVPTEKAIKTYVGTATTFAVQSEMEAATEMSKPVSPEALRYSPAAAKFWCYYDPVAGTIRASHNVASISTQIASTEHRLTFTKSFSSSDYVVLTSFKETTGTGASVACIIQDQTSGYVDIRISNTSTEGIYVVGFGTHS